MLTNMHKNTPMEQKRRSSRDTAGAIAARDCKVEACLGRYTANDHLHVHMHGSMSDDEQRPKCHPRGNPRDCQKSKPMFHVSQQHLHVFPFMYAVG